MRAAPSVRREVGSAGRCRTRTRIIPSCRDGAVAAGSIGGVPRRWCCSGGVSACAGGAGGDALAIRGIGEDKGEEGQLLDTVWSGVELAVDDQNLAALSGLCHADIGIARARQNRHEGVSLPCLLKKEIPFATRCKTTWATTFM